MFASLEKGAFFDLKIKLSLQKENNAEPINTEEVKKLREKVKNAKSITIIDYQGLDVNAINDFRLKISQQEAETVISKNTY